MDGQRGLSSAEAAARAQRFGPNEFAAGRAESRWHAFLRQYRDPMQLVLLAAGIGSLYPLKQLGTGILLVLLTLFNAVEGLHQEGKATAAVSALRKMVVIKARVQAGRPGWRRSRPGSWFQVTSSRSRPAISCLRTGGC